MRPPYTVIPYHIGELKRILASESLALPSYIERKQHTQFFQDYFKYLNAVTVLIERDYVDRDYIEDYAGFYARCYGDYARFCTRLHFFDRRFTSQQFTNLVLGKKASFTVDDLQSSYLGFVVVKRLPKTFLGRTCLKTYDTDNGRRYYPIRQEYHVGLYGLQLHIKETLAFQEQDRGASACATSALWSLFQGTGRLFHHTIPSPVEITRIATQIPDEAVPGFLPSRGLTGKQEIFAIRQLGLEAAYTNAQEPFNLFGSIYAYLRAGIPLLLRVILFDVSDSRNVYRKGAHAIAVTGFSLGKRVAAPYGLQQFRQVASRIDKLYVHDDQVGPFARMVLDGVKVKEKGMSGSQALISFSTSWRGEDRRIGSVRAVPHFLLIPLYPKIRIRFEFIRDVIIEFDRFMKDLIGYFRTGISADFEWDIHLIRVNDLKSELRDTTSLATDVRRQVLLQNMPRFIWRVRASLGSKVFLELLFDATEVEQGRFFVCGVEHDAHIYQLLRIISRSISGKVEYQSRSDWRIIEWFSKN